MTRPTEGWGIIDRTMRHVRPVETPLTPEQDEVRELLARYPDVIAENR